RAWPGVRDGVVVLRGRGAAARLVAYVVWRGAPEVVALREALTRRLPEPMLPAAFVAIASVPLTRNGKLDEAALPAWDETSFAAAPYAPPRTPTEQALAGLWAELLDARQVGAGDSFFALGGHSL